MARWVKCSVCKRVYDQDVEPTHAETCKPQPKRERKPSAESVRKHRERTGNAYGKAYAKARASAVKQLIEMHPQDFAELLEKARIDAGLGPTRG